MKQILFARIVTGLFVVALIMLGMQQTTMQHVSAETLKCPTDGLGEQQCGQTTQTVCIEGTVDRVDNGSVFGGDIKVGDSMTGNYTYDTTIQDSSPANPESGTYAFTNAPNGLLLQVNGITFQTNPDNLDLGITVVEGLPGKYVDEILVSSAPAEHNLPLTNGADIIEIGIYYINNTSNAISNDSLPTDAPDLNTWTDTRWFVDGPEGGYFGGHLTAVSTC